MYTGLMFAILACLCSAAFAQPNDVAQSASAPNNQPTTAAEASPLQQQIAAAQASTTLSTESRDAVIKLLQDAITQQEEADSHAEKLKQLDQRIDGAAVTLEKGRAELAKATPSKDALQARIQATPLETAEVQLRDVQQKLQDAKQTRETAEQAVSDQEARPDTIQAALAQLRDKLDTWEADLKIEAPAEEPGELTAARQTLLKNRLEAGRAKQTLLERELAAQAVLLSLLRMDVDQRLRDEAVAKMETQLWQAFVTEARKAANLEAVRASEADVRRAERMRLPEGIRAVAEVNASLATRQRELHSLLAQSQQQLERIEEQTDQLARHVERTKKRIGISGLDKTNGLLLRRMQETLPSLTLLIDDTEGLTRQIGEAEMEQLDISDQRHDLMPLDDTQAELLAAHAQGVPKTDWLEQEVRGMLTKQLALLDSKQEVLADYTQALLSLDTAKRQLLRDTTEFSQYISSRLLWAQSNERLRLRDFVAGHKPLAESRQWGEVPGEIWRAIAAEPLLWVCCALLIALSIASWYFTPAWMKHIAWRGYQPHASPFLATSQACLLTCLHGPAIPLVLMFLADRVQDQLGTPAFTRIVLGEGFQRALLNVAILAGLRSLCMHHGLGESHFNWTRAACKHARKHLLWFIFAAPIFIALVGWTEQRDDDAFRLTTGRPAFILLTLLITAFIVALLRPHGAMRIAMRERTPHGLFGRWWWLTYTALLALPAFMAFLAVTGYYYTAMFLRERVSTTAGFLLVGMLLYELLRRWVTLQHKRMAKRIDAYETEDTSVGKTNTAGRRTRFAEMKTQNHAAIRTIAGITLIVGVYLIWNPLLPALLVLEGVPLWQYTTLVDGQLIAQSVTLAEVAIAILYAVATYAGARNIPGVLEITFLGRLPMDHGTRYATTTIVRYCIIAVGVVLTLQHLGVDWSKLQWLVAALSVGLGFGLQEIVANFVSGLIVLFERPYRIGDLVTIGNVTGRVTRIQIRATTITNFDRQELIVPNKDFITGEVINWSLTDNVTRIKVTLVVSHGTDAEAALGHMLAIANTHPSVLKDPEVTAVLKGVSENGQTLELRAYVGEIAERAVTSNELHQQVMERFKAEGIKLAYPRLLNQTPPA